MIQELQDTHFLHIYFRLSSIFFLPISTAENTPFGPDFSLFFPPFPSKRKFWSFFFFKPFLCLSKRHFPAFLKSIVIDGQNGNFLHFLAIFSLKKSLTSWKLKKKNSPQKGAETPFWTPGRVFMMFLTLFGHTFFSTIFGHFYCVSWWFWDDGERWKSSKMAKKSWKNMFETVF